MQLFITNDFKIIKNTIEISEKRIVDQLRKVLRAKKGYKFFLQDKVFFEKGKIVNRYEIELDEIKNIVKGKILTKLEHKIQDKETEVITAILNKFDKMELIVQKLTELGVGNISFVPTKRSVFKNIKENKLDRFHKISLEAAEQSWSYFLPNIKIYKNLSSISHISIFDFDGEYYKNVNFQEVNTILVGPEGGFEKEEILNLDIKRKISLGDKILRAETAAVIGGFLISYE